MLTDSDAIHLVSEEAAMTVVAQRMTATLEGDEPDGGFVVFLIGMRINAWWRIHRWLPVALAMGPMLSRLFRHPELGLLGARTLVGLRGPTVVQYWRSSDHLLRFARDTDSPHLEAWRRFNRRVGTNGAVGIWHETYVVPSGHTETIYGNMPLFGLGRVKGVQPVGNRGETAAERLGNG
jgi:hypothetical protein